MESFHAFGMSNNSVLIGEILVLVALTAGSSVNAFALLAML
jgi:hypothetical protein